MSLEEEGEGDSGSCRSYKKKQSPGVTLDVLLLHPRSQEFKILCALIDLLLFSVVLIRAILALL